VDGSCPANKQAGKMPTAAGLVPQNTTYPQHVLQQLKGVREVTLQNTSSFNICIPWHLPAAGWGVAVYQSSERHNPGRKNTEKAQEASLVIP
jgi:hypothetical protein